MATAGTTWNAETVLVSTPTAILNVNSMALKVMLVCSSSSASSLRINMNRRAPSNTSHGTYDPANAKTYFTLAAGQSVTFEGTVDNPITSIIVDGDTGTATFSGSVTR